MIPEKAHVSEENKIRNLLEKIAEELNSQNIGNFFARTSNFDGGMFPRRFDPKMNYITRKKDDGEEIVLGIHGKVVEGFDKKRHIMAYFFNFDVHQAAKKHIEEYSKREGISSVFSEEFYSGKF